MVGGTIGGVALLSLLAVGFVLRYRQQRKLPNSYVGSNAEPSSQQADIVFELHGRSRPLELGEDGFQEVEGATGKYELQSDIVRRELQVFPAGL